MPKKGKKKKHFTQSFRAGVGAIILNEDGKVLGLERKDIPDAWQMPQGGLEENETPEQAVKREVCEETGIEASNLELIASTPGWLAYELPEEARSKKIGRGQVQRWFLFRFRSRLWSRCFRLFRWRGAFWRSWCFTLLTSFFFILFCLC